MKNLKFLTIVAISVFVLAAAGTSVALPPPAPNLDVMPWIGNTNPQVESTYQYTTTVRNIGNRAAQSVVLTINFPVTNTSPNKYILGKLIGALPTGCTLALPPNRTKVTCNLGNMDPNVVRPITFGFEWQVALGTQTIESVASTASTNEVDGNNNRRSLTPTLTYPDNIVTTGTYAVSSCTGRGLTSYYECEITPSSIQSVLAFDVDSGGTLSVTGYPLYTGIWDQNTLINKSLHINIPSQIDYNGFAVSSTCFEGITTFTNNTVYNSAYRVCRQ